MTTSSHLRLWTAFGALLLWVGGCSFGDNSQASGGQPARLKVEDGRIVGAEERPVRLRGVNAFALNESGSALPSAEFSRMADAGFNVVRLIAFWDQFEPLPPESARPRYDQNALRGLDTAVQRAEAAGLYVILSPVTLYKLSPAFGGRGVPGWLYDNSGRTLEDANGSLADDAPVNSALTAWLRLVAERYRDEPAVAAIDAVNEPPLVDPENLLAWHSRLAAVVHEAAPETLMLFEPSFGDRDLSGIDLRRLPHRNVTVVSPHFYYAGGEGAGYGPDGAQAGNYVWDGESGYGGAAEDLAAHLRVTLDAARRADLPVWVGEFGIGSSAEGAERWLSDVTALFEREQVGWAYWIHQSRDPFSLVDSHGDYGPLSRPLTDAAGKGA